MSFFSKLKHALGFGDDLSDELMSDTEDDVPAATDADRTETSSDTQAATQDGEGETGFNPQMRSRIFDHVVAVFNGAMPDFIRNSVDTNAQSEYIYKTLDDSIKEYFDSYEAAVAKRVEAAHEQRGKELASEIERMRAESRKIEDDRSAIKERQLSADRQKRALGDRVHELEQQLGALDAEREQLQLENKSMLNKLKVAKLQGSDPELASRCKELEEKTAELIAANESLRQENARLHEAVDKQSDMHAISEAMMGDLRQSAAKSREELNRQKEAYDAAVKELEQLRERLKESESLVSDMRGLNEQLSVIMAELDKREARINKLKKDKAELRREVEALRAVTESVMTEENTAPYGGDTAAPEASPDTFRAEAPAEPAQETVKRGSRAGSRVPRITDEALDEVENQFNSEHWSTDTHESSRPSADKDSSRQNRRKHNPADDVQLSLF
ncbi:MAG: hypothetical protein K2H03_03590 [Muribaculaceae bacterium]|nr:hypothetical protein [Muribaculaceae bacterium]MDE5929545.1 hypothetical protein [Muribaculaceae bacterium]